MATPDLTSSANLHLGIGAFVVLYAALSGAFAPLAAFALAVVASTILAKL